jgi:hypothetical protein
MTATALTAPRLVYLFALCVSFAMAGIVTVVFLQIGPSPSMAFVVPLLASGLGALAFAIKWPNESWRWGIWLSCGFWAFFLAVFVSYLSVGTLDWLTPVRAASVVAAGVIGAALGRKLRRPPAGNL